MSDSGRPTIHAAIQRLERTFVREGRATLRKLVLDAEPLRDITWPDAPAVHDDVRQWLAWRALPDHPLWLDLPAAAPHRMTQMVCVGGAHWEDALRRASAAGRPELVPFLEHFFCDGRDGSVYVEEWDAEGAPIFRRYADHVAAVLSAIEAVYAARAQSAWRTYRVERHRDAKALEEATRWETAEAERSPVGTLLITHHAAARRFAKRGSVALKLRTDAWMLTPNRLWDGGENLDEAVDDWLQGFRSDLAHGTPALSTDAEAAARLQRDVKKEGGAVHVGAVHVWRQPTIEVLIARFDAALARFDVVHESLRPGLTEAALRRAEQTLGVELPESVRRLYAFADGQTGQPVTGPSVYWRYRFVPLAAALETNEMMRDLRDQQWPPAYWSDRSLPLLQKGTGDLIYIDIDGQHANAGALVDFNHEKPAERRVLHRDLTEWLECFVDAVEDDLFQFEDGGVFPTDFLDTGDMVEIGEHADVRTHGRYPWLLDLDRPR